MMPPRLICIMILICDMYIMSKPKAKYYWKVVVATTDPNTENILTSAHGPYLATHARKAARSFMTYYMKDKHSNVYVMLRNASDVNRRLSDIYHVYVDSASGKVVSDPFPTKGNEDIVTKFKEMAAMVKVSGKDKPVVYKQSSAHKKMTPHTKTTKIVHTIVKRYFADDYMKYKNVAKSSLLYKMKDEDMRNANALGKSGRGLLVVFTMLYDIVMSNDSSDDTKIDILNKYLISHSFVFRDMTRDMIFDVVREVEDDMAAVAVADVDEQVARSSAADMFRVSRKSEGMAAPSPNDGCIIS